MNNKPMTLDEWEYRRRQAMQELRDETVMRQKQETERLKNDVNILKDALSFYADARNYLADVESDLGELARNALRLTEHED